MSDKTLLPPQKKIRLIKPIASNSGEDRNENNNFNVYKVFEWNDEKLNELVYGYTRNNIKFAIPDILSIILIYIKHLFMNYI